MDKEQLLKPIKIYSETYLQYYRLLILLKTLLGPCLKQTGVDDRISK